MCVLIVRLTASASSSYIPICRGTTTLECIFLFSFLPAQNVHFSLDFVMAFNEILFKASNTHCRAFLGVFSFLS